MKDTQGLVMVGLIGLGLWALSRGKLPIEPPAIPQPTIPPVVKPLITETPSISLDVWQGLAPQRLATLPVTQQTGQVGNETYYKTSQPVAIGDTGFKIWGTTESGATVVSQRDPATYDPREWMMT